VLSLTGHLPKRVVRFRPGLAQFEIRGTHLVRERAAREGGEQNHEEECAFHFVFATGFSSMGSGRSMVTT
jgi:hypothetical protein